MMPPAAQHTNRSVWGDAVNEFNHARYTPGNKRGSPIAFRRFGGGTTLCLGRNFASIETVISNLLVIRFDFYPVDYKWILLVKAPMVNALPVLDWYVIV